MTKTIKPTKYDFSYKTRQLQKTRDFLEKNTFKSKYIPSVIGSHTSGYLGAGSVDWEGA